MRASSRLRARHPRRTERVLRASLRRLAPLLAAAALCALTLPSAASADTSICAAGAGAGAGKCENVQGLAIDFETERLYVSDQGNNRIDVFEPDGSFAFGFGWGVADGKAELQSCGPAATPPTVNCLKGLGGGGAGALGEITDIAVDNDPGSPSHHDVYVLDGRRIQKFDDEGNFLLTWGGGVITGGAAGTGNLSSGSNQITAVKTTEKRFAIGQTITGAGIPAETKISALGAETITLSKPTTASGTAVALSVAEGAGNVPANETQVLTINSSDPGHPVGSFNFSTPNPSPSQTSAPVNFVNPPPASGPGSLQEALEGMANIGPGNVAVTGSPGDYIVEFKGTRYADTDVNEFSFSGSGNISEVTTQNGGGAAEICTAAIAVSCNAGIKGDGEGQLFENPRLAVGPGGVVYVVDCVGSPDAETCKNRLQKFEPDGDFIAELALPQGGGRPEGVAVDSSGDFYVSVNSAIRKYDTAANLLKELPVAKEIRALATDAADHLFAAERDGEFVIAEYDPAGNPVRRFGYGVIKLGALLPWPSGLAPHQSATGDIYAAEEGGVIHRAFPPPGPLIAAGPCKAEPLGNFKATLNAEINPEGKATDFRFEYLTDEQFKEGGFSNPDKKTSEEAVLGGPGDILLHKASIQVTGLQPETTYHCRAVAENADSLAPVTGDEGVFKTKEGFEFGSAWASDVGEEEATVKVEGNPLGIPATGQIEYVEDAKYKATGFTEALSAPEGELDFGASEAMQTRSATLVGLTPGTLYHYRLRARNGTPPAGIICPEQKLVCPELERTFKTYLPEAPEADQRRWELVSPVQKNSADVAVPGNAGGFIEIRFVRIQAGADSGEAITYTSWTSFGDAEGAQAASQYLSKRSEAGWLTENISPFGSIWSPLMPPYLGFSPDLKFGAFKTTSPVLTPGCRNSIETLYLRDNETGELSCLMPEEPGGLEPCPVYSGISEDGERVFFAAGPEGGEGLKWGLYEWSQANGIQLISVFPNGDPAPATIANSYGPAGARFSGGENCGTTQRVMRHAVSGDGSHAFWTFAPDKESEPTQLYARVNGTETVQLDLKQPSGAAAGNGVFRAASADGSVVYFTDTEKLISGSKAENGKPDLYRYRFGVSKAQTLVDLTKGSEPGDVKGVVGASEDGSHVYFVAGAVLSEEPNSAGQKAQAGKNNLYLFHEDKTTFIATLAGEDNGDWAAIPRELRARVSPDGKHLAFLSVEAEKLAGYDNRVATGEHCQWNSDNDGKVELVGGPLCPQAFVYEAETGELSCASCNPSGARPLGPTVVPGWSNGFEGPRFLSDDGSRIFFQSFDELLPADENGMGDVYEFERPGSGTCEEDNPNFDPASGGCHFLLSGGKSEDETFLVDASSDGRDVFFSTRARLVGWDDNDNYDVYDYRAGGGFPEPPPPSPICEGEGCKPPTAPTPPSGSSPGSATFQGPGNVAKPRSTRCPKGKVRRRGRCIKPKPRGGKSQRKRGNHKRGAAR